MDFDTLLRGGQFVFTVLVGMFSMGAARKASSKADARALEERLNKQDSRITILEQQIAHLPDSQQLAELAGDMKAIKAELEGVARSLDPLTRSVDRINDYLLNARA
ncbi:hypothetical protein WP8S17C03_22900 [Metapseudomonas otitidis]|uniref:DUF2730 domain-containing protein n=1 Tax=Metapseudomonas otitidis TaxID=319939 RepID=A0A6S5RJL9_9GAMM|nr:MULTISPECIES: DUF2730 family protein [Pseudomonas]BBT16241.1 hypothetical protein WP8S17C03_22900 [Pseudomonas otitidis]